MRKRTTAALGLLAVMLCACSTTWEDLGFEQSATRPLSTIADVVLRIRYIVRTPYGDGMKALSDERYDFGIPVE